MVAASLAALGPMDSTEELGHDSSLADLVGESEAQLAEDDCRNRKQAVRNRRIRGLLDERKKLVGSRPKAQGGFDEVEEHAAAGVGGGAAAEAEKAPPPWFAIRDEPSVNLRLHEELLDFLAFIQPTSDEAAARRSWVTAIETAAKSLWGRCQVSVFGSSSTGLCLPTADVDVVVSDIDAGVSVTTAMKQLAEKLLERNEVSKLEIIQSAKVPVLKLQQRSTGLMADLIFNRLDGLETSRFIREQIELFPALVPLVLFIKLYLLQRGLSDTYTGGMGSFLLVVVVLSFLQRHPSARDTQIHAKTTLGMLALDFFRHYGQEFKYGNQGISVLKGGSLFSRDSRGWTGTDRNGRPTLCVESPLEPTVDIGAKCFKIGVVRAAFNHGYHVLGAFFVARTPPGHSLLCPALLNPSHLVVAERHQIMKEQPPALFTEACGVEEDDDEEEGDGPPKRRRLLSDLNEPSIPTVTADAPVAATEGNGAPAAAISCEVEVIDDDDEDVAEAAEVVPDAMAEGAFDPVPGDDYVEVAEEGVVAEMVEEEFAEPEVFDVAQPADEEMCLEVQEEELLEENGIEAANDAEELLDDDAAVDVEAPVPAEEYPEAEAVVEAIAEAADTDFYEDVATAAEPFQAGQYEAGFVENGAQEAVDEGALQAVEEGALQAVEEGAFEAVEEAPFEALEVGGGPELYEVDTGEGAAVDSVGEELETFENVGVEYSEAPPLCEESVAVMDQEPITDAVVLDIQTVNLEEEAGEEDVLGFEVEGEAMEGAVDEMAMGGDDLAVAEVEGGEEVLYAAAEAVEAEVEEDDIAAGADFISF
mmetsp:Transcript_112726/g.318587  ORF Transcript_112726/g.318587 Transcript_112726/m.318587 type:complete len:815 (-) Transcript_112726:126-2570(-)